VTKTIDDNLPGRAVTEHGTRPDWWTHDHTMSLYDGWTNVGGELEARCGQANADPSYNLAAVVTMWPAIADFRTRLTLERPTTNIEQHCGHCDSATRRIISRSRSAYDCGGREGAFWSYIGLSARWGLRRRRSTGGVGHGPRGRCRNVQRPLATVARVCVCLPTGIVVLYTMMILVMAVWVVLKGCEPSRINTTANR